MKTKDLWNKYIATPANEKKLNFSYAEFEKDVKSLSNWISVEEELPELDVMGMLSEIILVKHKDSDISLCYNFIDFDKITHWRPIEIL